MEKKAKKEKTRKRVRKECEEETKKEKYNNQIKVEVINEGNPKADVDQQRKIPRPKSPYMFFAIEYTKINPQLSLIERMKAAGIKWKSMEENEKTKFKILADNDKLRYQREIGEVSQPKDTRISAFEMSKLKKRREKD